MSKAIVKKAPEKRAGSRSRANPKRQLSRAQQPSVGRRWMGIISFGALAVMITLAIVSFNPADTQARAEGEAVSNWIGPVGHAVAHVIYRLLGISAWGFALAMLSLAALAFTRRGIRLAPLTAFGWLLFASTLSAITHLLATPEKWSYSPGGALGAALADLTRGAFSFTGSLILLIALLLMASLLATHFALAKAFELAAREVSKASVITLRSLGQAWLRHRYARKLRRQQREEAEEEELEAGEDARYEVIVETEAEELSEAPAPRSSRAGRKSKTEISDAEYDLPKKVEQARKRPTQEEPPRPAENPPEQRRTSAPVIHLPTSSEKSTRKMGADAETAPGNTAHSTATSISKSTSTSSFSPSSRFSREDQPDQSDQDGLSDQGNWSLGNIEPDRLTEEPLFVSPASASGSTTSALQAETGIPTQNASPNANSAVSENAPPSAKQAHSKDSASLNQPQPASSAAGIRENRQGDEEEVTAPDFDPSSLPSSSSSPEYGSAQSFGASAPSASGQAASVVRPAGQSQSEGFSPSDASSAGATSAYSPQSGSETPGAQPSSGQSDQSDQSGQSSQSDQSGRSEQSIQSEGSNQSHRLASSAQAHSAALSTQMAQTVHPGQPDPALRSSQTSHPNAQNPANQSTQSGHSAQANPPKQKAQSDQLDQTAQIEKTAQLEETTQNPAHHSAPQSSLQPTAASQQNESASSSSQGESKQSPTIVEPRKVPKPVKTAKQEGFTFAKGQDGFHTPDFEDILEGESHGDQRIDRAQLTETAERLQQKLHDLGVDGEVTEIRPGPVVTMYEFRPASGIKLSRIASLGDDLAMAMEALRVRIVAPIPGKGVVGFEVPNKVRETVYLKEVVEQAVFQKAGSKLTMAIGKDIEGLPYVSDLGKMPHLLIAGTTGSGKSVGVNSMLVSMLMRATPEELRFIMVDPKMLELSIYEGIPHLLLPVVVDPKKAALALRWGVEEMERRYQLLADAGVRNITQYNKHVEKELARRTLAALENPSDEHGDDVPPESAENELKKLPFIVIVIDELADLMMVAAKEVEVYIARLAQMARAAGIHLMVATQRPSTDVLTGVIKANFPTRISFHVASRHDSATIINSPGAENLLGMGDMLVLPPGTSSLSRVHGAYVSESEINRLTAFWKSQGAPIYDPEILKPRDEGSGDGDDDQQVDELYDHAIAAVSEMEQVSISLLQRKMRIGYNRAARMIEQMERDGIVGPADGARPREVLIRGLGEMPGV